MKILVLNGSPKREKGDTLHLTNAFLTGMKDFAEQEVHIRHVIDQHIEPCITYTSLSLRTIAERISQEKDIHISPNTVSKALTELGYR